MIEIIEIYKWQLYLLITLSICFIILISVLFYAIYFFKSKKKQLEKDIGESLQNAFNGIKDEK